MSKNKRLMCIFAHPDDESLGVGGILAKYAATSIETSLVTATRGQRGWTGPDDEYPGPDVLGEIRTAELEAAAAVLQLGELSVMGYMDGELDQVDPAEIIARLVGHLRRFRPQVVVTFDPHGSYGHPDHIAISQFATAAIVAAADAGYLPQAGHPHRVSKFYYMASTRAGMLAYQAAFGDLVMKIDGVERRDVSWEDWAITTKIDTRAYWRQVWQAVSCHHSQLPAYAALGQLPDESQAKLWGTQYFYRAFSLVNGGRQLETDLFAGLHNDGQPLLEDETVQSPGDKP